MNSQLAVFLGNGDGTFKPAVPYLCPVCDAVAAADLDGDGDIDVLATGFKPVVSPGALYVFLNEGGGRLSKRVGYELRGNALAVAVGDLNDDGALDVVTANDRSYSVSVLLGKGDGTFAEAETHPAGNTQSVTRWSPSFLGSDSAKPIKSPGH